MRIVELNEGLSMKLSPGQRLAIEMLAAQENLTLGGAARIFLDAGIDALRKD